MTDQPDQPAQFEQRADGEPPDETDVSLRAYLSRLSDDHLRKYSPAWTDEQVMAWDDNFRNDGNLMLVCCERDVDVHEFRQVLEEHLRLRGLHPDSVPNAGSNREDENAADSTPNAQS